MSPPKVLFAVLALALAIALPASASPDFIIEMFRHGARGPLNDTFDPVKLWGDNVGELTPVGMRMHYLLGKAMQQSYPTNINQYDPESIEVRCTDFNRTIMSAFSHFLGAYENTGPGIGNATADLYTPPYNSSIYSGLEQSLDNSEALPYNIQPVPVHVIANPVDSLFVPFMTCSSGPAWMVQNMNDTDTTNIFNNVLNDTVAYLRNQSLAINSLLDLNYAGDNAVANKFAGYPLPGNVDPNSQYYKDMKFATEWYTAKLFGGQPQQKAVYSIVLLNALLDDMRSVQNGTSTLKSLFYSCHDSSMMILLNALNITTTDCLLENYLLDKQGENISQPFCIYPQYASNFIFEFHTGLDETDSYFTMLYDGVPVPLCANSTNCTLAQFAEIVQAATWGYSVPEYDNFCAYEAPPQPVNPTDPPSGSFYMLFLETVCVILLVSLMLSLFTLRRKTKQLLISRNSSNASNDLLQLGQI